MCLPLAKMRVVTSNDTTWFFAKDVARALGYVKPPNAIRRHVSQPHKMIYADMGDQTGHCYQPQSVFIDATGAYSLVLGSNLSSTKALKGMDMTDTECARLALTNLESKQ